MRKSSESDAVERLEHADDMGDGCRSPSMSTFGPKSGFHACEKSQLPLILLGFLAAFQADDDGSIPFTRSNTYAKLLRCGAPLGRG